MKRKILKIFNRTKDNYEFKGSLDEMMRDFQDTNSGFMNRKDSILVTDDSEIYYILENRLERTKGIDFNKIVRYT